MPNIRAAGTVPWRHRAGALEVALVHRPKYDDWSWTKGKLDADELWQVAAVRETLEETGLHVRLGMPLPPTAYRVLDRTGHPATKQVRYWAATVVGGVGSLENEIDEVVWLDVAGTHDRLAQGEPVMEELRQGETLPRARGVEELDEAERLTGRGLNDADGIFGVLLQVGELASE